ncbi:hypothetical protein MKQ70_04720 [Chitinophaga sedimenti]|uniref:hypothetical protein n=1 Tax=Chitinophaga sedimenti TaxID=2033606 RepID=UPI002006CD9B|nr:hypothetical protein [Chitinophaga sedimenti]MCK7554346.1 hypothetical protein [Chitinophaga sedimenti]
MSQFSKYDSEFCGNLPIHIINTIQRYGVLLVWKLLRAALSRPAKTQRHFFPHLPAKWWSKEHCRPGWNLRP